MSLVFLFVLVINQLSKSFEENKSCESVIIVKRQMNNFSVISRQEQVTLDKMIMISILY